MDADDMRLLDANHAMMAGMVVGYLHQQGLIPQPLSVHGEYTADFTLEIPELGIVTLRVLPSRISVERKEHRVRRHTG